jgi:hypothetical protein
LAIGKNALRPRDIPDVKAVELSNSDIERFFNKINDISHENPALALRIEGLFKQIRPEFVVTDQRFAYTNEKEIATYVRNWYGIDISKDTLEQWQEDITNLVKKPSSIIGYIDYKMGEEIDAGNTVLKSRDATYRKQKEKDYGLDL